MLKKIFLIFLLLFIFTIHATECNCDFNKYFFVKHIEGKGIGYDKGYSSLAFFWTPVSYKSYMPFFDLRCHIFDNGKPAVNAGGGIRYISSRIYGINAYYDFRKTSKDHYNQISLGLESLGQYWDFRINGYFPFGKTKSNLFTKFDSFDSHHMILSSKREFAMSGASAEAEGHIEKKNIIYSLAAGPYFLHDEKKNAFGAQTRGSLDFCKYVHVECNLSYDTLFKWVCQGQLGITIPFKSKAVAKKSTRSCCYHEACLLKRATDPVYKNEIIAIDTRHKKSIAINPATNDPFQFWFVNNQSHSSGTFQNPFSNLHDVELSSNTNDIIYVFCGDGTDRGMNSGFNMKDGQRLLGAGMSHNFETTLGSIKTPILSATPTISNFNNPHIEVTLGSAVGVGNSCEVSGFILKDYRQTSCISTPLDILNNCKITNNTFYTYYSCIFLSSSLPILGCTTGNIIIENNKFFGLESDLNYVRGIYVKVLNGNVIVKNNYLSGLSDNGGFTDSITVSKEFPIDFDFKSSAAFVQINNNIITPPATLHGGLPSGIYVDNVSVDTVLISIFNNYIKLPREGWGVTIIANKLPFEAPAFTKATLYKNVSLTPPPPGYGYFFQNTTGHSDSLQIDFNPNNIGTRFGP